MSTPVISPVPVAITPVRSIIGATTAASTGASSTGPSSIKITSALHTETIIADAVPVEEHDDESVITENPVEVGSVVTDHMYKLPARLELLYAWSLGSQQNASQDPSFLKNLYQQILKFQVERFICTVNTGKRVYQNMLVKRIEERTDLENENSMTLRITFQEMLFATISIGSVPSASVQQFPNKTAPVVNQGTQSLTVGTSTFNGGGTLP